MIWERGGTIEVVNGSATVTGTGTTWATAAVLAGYGLIGPDLTWYEIDVVNSSTEITLATTYEGATASGQAYVIVPTSGANEKIHADIQEFLTFARARVNDLDVGLTNLQSDYATWKAAKIAEIDALITSKTSELDALKALKQGELDALITAKTTELDALIAAKGAAADDLITNKTTEIDALITAKTAELDGLKVLKEGVLDTLISDKTTELDALIASKGAAADAMIAAKGAAADTMIANKAAAADSMIATKSAEVDALVQLDAPLRLIDGDAAAPVFAFKDQIGTGFFRKSDGSIGVAQDGAEIGSLPASFLSGVSGHSQRTDNPHAVTAAQVGAHTQVEVNALLAQKLGLSGGAMTGALNLPVGGLDVGAGHLKVDAAGRVRKSSQPNFRVKNSAAAWVAADVWEKMTGLDQVALNVGSGLNPANSRFTAPIDGMYLFEASVHFSAASSRYLYSAFYKNGSIFKYGQGLSLNSTAWIGDNDLSWTSLIHLMAGDYVEPWVYSSVANSSAVGRRVFAGYFLG